MPAPVVVVVHSAFARVVVVASSAVAVVVAVAKSVVVAAVVEGAGAHETLSHLGNEFLNL